MGHACDIEHRRAINNIRDNYTQVHMISLSTEQWNEYSDTEQRHFHNILGLALGDCVN